MEVDWTKGIKGITRTTESCIEEKEYAVAGKFRFIYYIEYSDGATRECIEIKKEQLPNIPEGKRMSLIYPNGQVYTGFFGGLDDQQIILKSISKNHTIGLPYAQLSQILVERY